jgi:YrbI family 3-deoxy-D-manno-octulosonate 8-phosphate phosphatase
MKIKDLSGIDPILQQAICKIRLVAFDFDGVFTDNMVYVFEDGSEAVRCSRGDGIGLQKLKKLAIETVIISTEANPVVSARASKLKIRCVQDCPDKRKALENIAQETGISLSEVAFVGNDINDLPAFEIVGWAVAVADAFPEVIRAADFILSKPGGGGAVRELCELILKAIQEKFNGS